VIGDLRICVSTFRDWHLVTGRVVQLLAEGSQPPPEAGAKEAIVVESIKVISPGVRR